MIISHIDGEKGPIKTIQEAIDKAEPSTTISIAPGLYKENLEISKSDLILEQKNKTTGDVILLSLSRPNILINLKSGDKCSLIGLKFANQGINETQ